MAFAVSNFASKILVFLLIPIYTSVLSAIDYGIADLIMNTINVLYPILTLNIMESTLRFSFDKDVSKEEVLVNSIIFILFAEVILVAVTPIVGVFSKALKDYWLWFEIVFLGYNLQQVLSQYVNGIGKTKVFAISGVVHTAILSSSNIIGLLLFKLGLNAYLFSMAIGYFATVLYLIVNGKVRIKKVRINGPLLKDMLKFSLPTIPSNIAWWVSTSADKYIIIWCLDIASSGIYGVANKIPSILTILANIFTSAWTISAIQNIEDKDSGRFQSTIYKYFNAGNVLACSVLILLAQLLGKILFAKDFFSAWRYVPFLLVAYVFAGLSGFFASSFRAAKYTKGLFSSTSAGAIVNIILNFYFIKRFGLMGAAFTTMVGFAITFFVRCYSIKKVIDITFNLKKDIFVYLLLILQAFMICFEVPFSCEIATVIFAIIIFTYRKEYYSFSVGAFRILKRVLKSLS